MLCKNCKVELANDNGFCQDCGARVIQERISLKFLFQEFTDKVLSIDNKLLKTFFHLFTKPEEVIDGYINGVRKRYFNPISYLLISITLSGIYLYFFKDVAVESIESMQQVDPNNPFTDKDFAKNYMNFFSDYQAFFTALNIPIYAFISWLVFLNRKKYNFYEHTIIYLYTNSQISVVNFLVVVPVFFINKHLAGELFIYGSILFLIYSAYVLVRLFKLTFLQFLVKTLYFGFISAVLLLIFTILFSIGLIIYMGPEKLKQMGDQQKQKAKEIRILDSINKSKKDSLKTKTLVPR